MTQSVPHEIAVLAYSFVCGVFLAVLYDFFRLFRIACGHGALPPSLARFSNVKLPLSPRVRLRASPNRGKRAGYAAVLVTDILYFLLAAAVFSVFIAHTNNGKIRWYYLLMLAFGAFFYRATVGKAVFALLCAMVLALRVTVKSLISIAGIPVRFVFGTVRRLFVFSKDRIAAFLISKIRYRAAYAYTLSVRSKLSREIKFPEFSEVTSNDPQTARDS